MIDLYDAGFWEFTGFTGIDLLAIEVTGMYTDPVFDNLTYNPATPVPLPAGGALLISGVIGLGALRARNRAT